MLKNYNSQDSVSRRGGPGRGLGGGSRDPRTRSGSRVCSPAGQAHGGHLRHPGVRWAAGSAEQLGPAVQARLQVRHWPGWASCRALGCRGDRRACRTESGGRRLEQAWRLAGWWAWATRPGDAPDLAGAVTAADSGDTHVVLVPRKGWCAFGTGGAGGSERGGLGCASCVESGAWAGLSLTLRRLGLRMEPAGRSVIGACLAFLTMPGEPLRRTLMGLPVGTPSSHNWWESWVKV